MNPKQSMMVLHMDNQWFNENITPSPPSVGAIKSMQTSIINSPPIHHSSTVDQPWNLSSASWKLMIYCWGEVVDGLTWLCSCLATVPNTNPVPPRNYSLFASTEISVLTIISQWTMNQTLLNSDQPLIDHYIYYQPKNHQYHQWTANWPFINQSINAE